MQTSMKLLLTAPPDQCRAALRFGLPVAHVAYRVGGGPHLFRASIPVSVRGGLMVIDNTGFDGRGEAGPFCQEVLRECMARGYDGILCDFEGHPLQVLAQAVRAAGPCLLCQRADGTFRLAWGWEPRKAFPLPPVFCFGKVEKVGGRVCVVWTFSGEGRPVVPD